MNSSTLVNGKSLPEKGGEKEFWVVKVIPNCAQTGNHLWCLTGPGGKRQA